jgi:hypothetical protein
MPPAPAPSPDFWDAHLACPGPPRGADALLGGANVYITRPPGDDAAQPPRAVVICVPDCFGFRFTPTRTVADALAASSGATVVVPDVHAGNALSPDALARHFAWKQSTPAWQPARALHEAWGNVLWASWMPQLIGWMWQQASGEEAKQVAVLDDVAAAARAELGARCVGAFGAVIAGMPAVLLAGRAAYRIRSKATPAARLDALVVAHPAAPSDAALAALDRVACPSLWFFSDSADDCAAETAVSKALAARCFGEQAARDAAVAEFRTQPTFSAVADTGGSDDAAQAKQAEAAAALEAVLAQSAAFFKAHLRVEEP